MSSSPSSAFWCLLSIWTPRLPSLPLLLSHCLLSSFPSWVLITPSPSATRCSPPLCTITGSHIHCGEQNTYKSEINTGVATECLPTVSQRAILKLWLEGTIERIVPFSLILTDSVFLVVFYISSIFQIKQSGDEVILVYQMWLYICTLCSLEPQSITGEH